jgi:hypothetical protein
VDRFVLSPTRLFVGLFAILVAIPLTVAAQNKKALTVDDVISMAQAGISEDILIARLRKQDKPFDLSPGDMIRLKKVA